MRLAMCEMLGMYGLEILDIRSESMSLLGRVLVSPFDGIAVAQSHPIVFPSNITMQSELCIRSPLPLASLVRLGIWYLFVCESPTILCVDT